MSELTNPAKRALDLLQSVADAQEQWTANAPVKSVWMYSLGIDEDEEDFEEQFIDSIGQFLTFINWYEKTVKLHALSNADMPCDGLLMICLISGMKKLSKKKS